MRKLAFALTVSCLLACSSNSINIETARTKEIAERLSKNQELEAHDLSIDDRHGKIILDGTVSSEIDRTIVEQTALGVPGVKEVTNYITVLSRPGPDKRVREFRARLASSALANYDVDASFSNGDLVLSGEVSNPDDARRLEELARSIKGVDSIKSEIKVEPLYNDLSIQQRVVAALHQEQGLPADEISVGVKDGVVTLAGSLNNFRQIDQALATALTVEGVQDIESDLTIRGESYAPSRWLK